MAGLAALAAGCTVGPNFKPLVTASPPAYAPEPTDTPSRTTSGPVDETWWERFRDPELTSLVGRLVRQNLDLQTAAERIQQARAARAVVRSQGLPQVSGDGRYVRERESKNGLASLTEPAPGAPLEFDLAQPMLAASWELDLFGRVRRAVESADAQRQAAVEARRGLALAALADLAQTYMQLRGLQARQTVVEAVIRQADLRRKLVRDRYRDGVATLADVAQADAQAAAVAEGLPDLREGQARAVNALGVLLAEPPRALQAELTRPATQPLVPPAVPTGLPAELLRRRPDIREAEARLHAATAQTGVAVADFYPQVTLNGTFGFESLGTDHLFDWASRAFVVGPTVTVPLFEGGRLKGVLELRRSAEREAALQYRKTVLQAWREVDDAMTAYAEVQHRRADVFATVQADQVSLRVAERRFRDGVDTLIDVTVAQADLLRAQDTLAQTQADMTVRLVDLYRSLGGGWSAATGG